MAAATAANAVGLGGMIVGSLLALLIHLASIPIPPRSEDPAEQSLVAPYHNVTSNDLADGYGRMKWWYDEPQVDREPNYGVPGKVALITGGSSGIGRAVAAELCRLKADTVVITSRSLARAKKTAETMLAEGTCTVQQIYPAALDLADLDNVRSFATELLSRHSRLHYFVMNAGGATLPGRGRHKFDYVTPTGHEYSYVGNYLGHFLLLNLLLDTIEQSSPARITATSSIMHWATMSGDDLPTILPSGSKAMRSLEVALATPKSLLESLQQYSNTKFLQVSMCFELQRRLGSDSGITVAPLAPGFINSNIALSNRDGRILIGNPLARSPKHGAETTLHALLSPLMEGRAGYFLQPYWTPLHRGPPSWPWGFSWHCILWEVLFQRCTWAPHLWLPHPDAHRLEFGRQLWEKSLEAVGM